VEELQIKDGEEEWSKFASKEEELYFTEEDVKEEAVESDAEKQELTSINSEDGALKIRELLKSEET